MARSCRTRATASTGGGPVGRNVMANDGAGRRRVFAVRRESIAHPWRQKIEGHRQVRSSHLVSPMISASRIVRWIAMQLWTSFVHSDRTPVEHLSIQRRNRALGSRRLGHLHECDSAGFARIPILNERDGFDRSVRRKHFPQLRLRHGDIQVPDKNVSHGSTLFLIFPKIPQSGTEAEFQRRS
jgi:hypothetical protein